MYCWDELLKSATTLNPIVHNTEHVPDNNEDLDQTSVVTFSSLLLQEKIKNCQQNIFCGNTAKTER